MKGFFPPPCLLNGFFPGGPLPRVPFGRQAVPFIVPSVFFFRCSLRLDFAFPPKPSFLGSAKYLFFLFRLGGRCINSTGLGYVRGVRLSVGIVAVVFQYYFHVSLRHRVLACKFCRSCEGLVGFLLLCSFGEERSELPPRYLSFARIDVVVRSCNPVS